MAEEKEYGKLTLDQIRELVKKLPETRGQAKEFPRLLKDKGAKLKELGGWKSRSMVDRYAKYATAHLAVAASRIKNGQGGNMVLLSRFFQVQEMKKA
jgi:hypothetical protein